VDYPVPGLPDILILIRLDSQACMTTSVQVAAVPETSIANPIRAEWSRVRWTPAVKAFALTLGLRLFYSFFAAAVSPWLRLDPKLIQSNSLTNHLMSRDSHPVLYALLGVWERFDTLWYTQISRHGYENPAPTVFYPLYPGLIRGISFVTHSDLAAALLIATAASFFLFWGALRLFELDYPANTALRAVLLWVVWPASFAFFAGYPDSLLCALTVWSIYFARSSRWLPAGALGVLAGCTKAVGCFTALPLLWIAWKRRERGGLIAAVACVSGVACFEAWLAVSHFPPAAQVYRKYWATSTVAPWTSLAEAIRALAHGGDRLLLLNLGIFAIVGAAALMPAVRFEYKIYAIAAMCLFLTKHTQPLLQSTTRYSLSLFAAYPVLSARFQGLSFACLMLVCAVVNLFLLLTFFDWGLVI
jgi:hypothetical protein